MSTFAIIRTGGRQYRVTEGTKFAIERIQDTEEGKSVTFDEVLAVGEGDDIAIGAPTVAGASVVAEVLEQGRAAKVIAFKFKRRKGFHKTKGHRQLTTTVRVTSIRA